MPPKKSKTIKQVSVEENQQNDNPSNEQSKNQRRQIQEQFFKCKCGKKYGSLAAVHTHINNKHQSDKKGYKLGIINPKKNGQGQTTSIRMKDIAYDERQSELMCLSDNTLKDIFNYITQLNSAELKITDIMIGDDLEDSDFSLSDDENDQHQTKRDHHILEKLRELKQTHNLAFINENTKKNKDLQEFKLSRFTLSMIKEISKFFIEDFAAKIHLQLEIIAMKKKNPQLKDKFTNVENEMWLECKEILRMLEQYYDKWVIIKSETRIKVKNL